MGLFFLERDEVEVCWEGFKGGGEKERERERDGCKTRCNRAPPSI